MKKFGPALALALIAKNVNAMPLNPAVTQDKIYKTVCVAGWTSTVRPPLGYTNRVKRERLFALGLKPTDARFYELDHKIPLALGGSPRDRENLELQAWPEAKEKDRVEVCLYRAVCRGQIGLEEARKQIWSNWRATMCPVFY